MTDFDREASSVGSCCPLPLIQLERAVKGMQPGMVLRMTGDDPIFEAGVRDYCLAKGLEILDVRAQGSTITILIRV